LVLAGASTPKLVIPAKAGIQFLGFVSFASGKKLRNWIPAFAGMTSKNAMARNQFQKDQSLTR